LKRTKHGMASSPSHGRHKALLGGPEIYKEGAGEDKGGSQKTWTGWDEFGQCF
jgi:hypothetical protein